jgi:two-component system, NtrC family, sensor kinase
VEPGVEHRARECELVQVSGRRIPVSVSTVAVRTDAGQPRGVLVILRDLREVVGLRRRLATSERLAVVGQLASGIAHEINNPLAFVRSNLHHLERESAALVKRPIGELAAAVGAFASDAGEVIQESLEGVTRALRIVQDVNAFSHGGGDERQPLALAEAVDQALGVATMGLSSTIRIERTCTADAEVHGSPQRLKQLFLNLLVNAVRAVGERGCIRIDVRRQGDQVVATVTDDGVGIAPEDLTRVFDPFFVVRPSDPGAGLGLAVSHEIVRRHGGWIEVESQPGQGTRVRVSLPAWSREAPASAPPG